MNIEGAVAVVSGGSSGLGRACVLALAAAGARVVVLDLVDAGEGEPDGGGRAAGRIRFVETDVTDDAAVARAVAVAQGLGPVRIAVTCAGVAPAGRVLGRSGTLPVERFRSVLEINTVGTFLVAQHAAAAMRASDPVEGERGVLVLTSSIAAFEGQIGQVAYAASKGAVASMVLPLARELAADLVRVVGIAPGTFDTPLLAALGDEVRTELGGRTPHPARLGRPEEFASLVLHVCANAMLNGTVLRLDGALRMPPR